MHLASAGNALAPAYLTILSKGYEVGMEDGLMVAERGEDRFVANGLVELLGLIAIAETRGEQWQASEDEVAEFLKRFG